jgi:enoyl-CoA hydratase/carnithine racemase
MGTVLDKVQSEQCLIAVLHGACVGGGLELACACHIRVADETIFMRCLKPAGIFVGGGASVRLPKLIGVSRMTDMCLRGV